MVLALLAPVVQATPFTIDFTGVITNYQVASNSSTFTSNLTPLGGNLALSGTVTVDVAAGPVPGVSNPGQYSAGGFMVPGEFITSSLTYALGNSTVSNLPDQSYFDNVSITDMAGFDGFIISNLASNHVQGSPGTSTWSNLRLQLFGLNLVSPGTTGAGPSVVPDLTNVNLSSLNEFSFYSYNDGIYDGYMAQFRFETASVRPVPEPGSILLLGLGALAMAGVRRRNERSRMANLR